MLVNFTWSTLETRRTTSGTPSGMATRGLRTSGFPTRQASSRQRSLATAEFYICSTSATRRTTSGTPSGMATRGSPNQRIPNQTSKSHPAMSPHAGELHMVHAGNSSNDIWHSVWDGNAWSPNQRIPNQTSKQPSALASYGGVLHLLHLGKLVEPTSGTPSGMATSGLRTSESPTRRAESPSDEPACW